MEPLNLLFILSDQHSRNGLGCYGNPIVQTPHLDRLAEQGTVFRAAYTTCPICVPARASLATGRYVHQTGHWDNAFPYRGTPASWGHRLTTQGVHVDSIGKLHFSGANDDLGFTDQIEPLYVVDGVGDLLSCVRDDAPLRDKRPGLNEAGGGDSTYLRYDVRNADNACAWLQQHATDPQPWVLFLSFVCPHPPYIAPPDCFALYEGKDLPSMPQHQPELWPDHPALAHFRRFFNLDQPLPEAVWHKVMAAYYGACTHLDRQIGRVLEALNATGLVERTRILYTSDHGESLGARGLGGKFTMYDESAGVPLILAGPDVPRGQSVSTPVSLVDCFPTVLHAVGGEMTPEDEQLPGESLWRAATAGDRARTVLSEYHAVGSRHAIYMLRNRRYKYIHYVNEPAQLFDLIADPREEVDLALSPQHADRLAAFARELRDLLDPVATDARAKVDQQAMVQRFGGREAVIARGTFTNSPTPDEQPTFARFN